MSQSNGAMKHGGRRSGVESKLNSTQVPRRWGPRVESSADSAPSGELGAELAALRALVVRLCGRVEEALEELAAVREAVEKGKSKQGKGKSEKEQGGQTSNMERSTLNVEEDENGEPAVSASGWDGTGGLEETGKLTLPARQIGEKSPVECERQVAEVVGEREGGSECQERTSNIERSTPNVESKKRRRRRNSVITRQVQEQVCHYLQAGLSRRQAAAFIGCDHSAISKAAQRDRQFAEKLEQAERISEALPVLRIVKASRKSWRAAAWLVKHHHPHAHLRRERREEQDHETAESVRRTERLLRERDPDEQRPAAVDDFSRRVDEQMQELQRRREEGLSRIAQQQGMSKEMLQTVIRFGLATEA